MIAGTLAEFAILTTSKDNAKDIYGAIVSKRKVLVVENYHLR